MIVKQKSKVIPIEKSSTHYKMYKGGKLWLTAGITTLSMAGMMVATGELQTAHADTTTTANNTQQTATGGNAVTATTSGTSGQAGTITQPVNVDHSQLNNAVDQARQAGLTVNQQPTTTQTVSQDQVDAAKQNIQNDETKQAQQIQTITRQHQTEVSNVNNFNGSKGDTSQLDARVKEAQSIPGLTVVHDQDQTTVKKASDTQGIQEAVNNATQSNNDQAQSIQNAIDTQKQNYAKYQSQLNDLAKDQHVTGQVNWDNGGYMNAHPTYDITWHYDLQRKKVVVTNVHLTIPSGLAPKTGGGFWDTYVIKRAIDPAPVKDPTRWPFGKQGDATGVDGNSLKEKYFPGSLAFYAHNNKTQEEVKAIKDYHGSYDAIQNPDGTWSLITIYDRSGTSIQHDYPRYGDPAWAEWGETAPVATVTLPKLNTTSANYHYNQAAKLISKPNNYNK